MVMYSLKTKEKGRGVCGTQIWREDERLRNVTTQKINKSTNKKTKIRKVEVVQLRIQNQRLGNLVKKK